MPKNRSIVYENEVFFEIAYSRKSEKRFLRWAKLKGLRWADGNEIKETDGFLLNHIALNPDGTFSNVPAVTWIHGSGKAVRMDFFKFIESNGELDDCLLSNCSDEQLSKIGYIKSLI